jgi:hypothetical protein
MITDSKKLQHIRDSWNTVRILEARIKRTLNAGLFSLVPMMTNFKEVPESLLLLFAISVLEDTLEQLRDQGLFACEGRGLERLMKASTDKLSWKHFEEIQEIKNRRNLVAHHREFLRNGQCAQYLTAIEQELLAWGVLDSPIKGQFDISFKPSE